MDLDIGGTEKSGRFFFKKKKKKKKRKSRPIRHVCTDLELRAKNIKSIWHDQTWKKGLEYALNLVIRELGLYGLDLAGNNISQVESGRFYFCCPVVLLVVENQAFWL